MSLNLAQILPDDFLTPIARKTVYGLATTCILGAAVYAGYRVAAPEKHLIKQHRHPELNDQVCRNVLENNFIDRKEKTNIWLTFRVSQCSLLFLY